MADYPWEAQCVDVTYVFGLRCAELTKRNPYNINAPLNGLISNLMTELWDRNFSQSQIREAFEAAVKDMPRYAANVERRSPTSSELSDADYRNLSLP